MTLALQRMDNFVLASARGVSRRGFLRRIGGGALGAAFGTAFLLQRPDLAAAGHVPCSGTHCNSTRCYDSGYCHTTLRSRRRNYSGGYYCIGDTGGQACWEAAGYRCCDCCVDYDTGSTSCSLCGGYFWACGCYANI